MTASDSSEVRAVSLGQAREHRPQQPGAVLAPLGVAPEPEQVLAGPARHRALGDRDVLGPELPGQQRQRLDRATPRAPTCPCCSRRAGSRPSGGPRPRCATVRPASRGSRPGRRRRGRRAASAPGSRCARRARPAHGRAAGIPGARTGPGASARCRIHCARPASSRSPAKTGSMRASGNAGLMTSSGRRRRASSSAAASPHHHVGTARQLERLAEQARRGRGQEVRERGRLEHGQRRTRSPRARCPRATPAPGRARRGTSPGAARADRRSRRRAGAG